MNPFQEQQQQPTYFDESKTTTKKKKKYRRAGQKGSTSQVVKQNKQKKYPQEQILTIEQEQALLRMYEMFPLEQPFKIIQIFKKKQLKELETIEYFLHQNQQRQQKQKTTKQKQFYNNSKNANLILNQIYDNLHNEIQYEQISVQQFQLIFEEISEMFRQTNKQKKQINDFSKNCSHVKQLLINDFKQELVNYQNFQIDLTLPIVNKLQNFIFEIHNRKNLIKKFEQDFPLPQQKFEIQIKQNVINKIYRQKNQQKSRQPLFNNKYISSSFHQINKASIFNIDNKYSSQKDLMELHKQFSLPINQLKYVYKQLLANFNDCRQFLHKHYSNAKPKIKKIYIQTKPQNTNLIVNKKAKLTKRQQVDYELKNVSLKEIRQRIDYLFKLKQTLQITRNQIKSGNQRQQITQMINRNDVQILTLSKASKIKEYQRMMKDQQLLIDLHGYRQEQIKPLFNYLYDMIRQDGDQISPRLKRPFKGVKVACLTAITGKGLHSRGRISILKPVLVEWSKDKNLQIDEQIDRIKLHIPV